VWQVKSIILALTIFFGSFAVSQADEQSIFIGWNGTEFIYPENSPQIGLALSGGGARGLAQIGVLKAFEESNLAIGSIAGTSIGGIIGGLYASGFSADSIETIVKGINFPSLFSNRPSRTSMFLTQRPEKERFLISIRFDGFKPYIPSGLTAGQELTDLLTKLTLKANYLSGGNFSHLQIPFHAVTTDIVTGTEVVFDSGNLMTAMRSTMAFPLAFTGVEIDSMILMDGGIVNPIPADALPVGNNLIDMIVAINTTSNLRSKEEITSPLDIADQITSIMSLDDIKDGLSKADYIITLPLEGFNSADFEDADTLIRLGYLAGKSATGEIISELNSRSHSDLIHIADITYQDSLNGDSIVQLSIKSGDLLDLNSLRKKAGEYFLENNLLTLRVLLSPDDQLDSEFQSYNLEITSQPGPFIDRLDLMIQGNTVFDDDTILKFYRAILC
jgi:NTE family protein